jgi:hypothetical protein
MERALMAKLQAVHRFQVPSPARYGTRELQKGVPPCFGRKN